MVLVDRLLGSLVLVDLRLLGSHGRLSRLLARKDRREDLAVRFQVDPLDHRVAHRIVDNHPCQHLASSRQLASYLERGLLALKD